MGLRNFIKTNIRKYLNEQQILNESIKDILIRRIPFLKEYNIFKDRKYENRLEAQRVVFNKDIKVIMSDDILNFEQYNVVSEIFYSAHIINENTFHNFIIKNTFHVTQPKEMDDLTFRIFLIAKQQLEKKLSYSKEVIVKNNEEIPKDELDKIINEMNGVLFKIEEFTKKHSIDLY